MSDGKIFCSVPGCRRWSRKFKGEFLCGAHWRMVPRRLKRRRSWIVQRWKKDPRRAWRYARLEFRVWEQMKRAATREAFMGIGC